MVMEILFGKMEQDMMVNGKMEKPMEMVFFIILMVMCTKVSLKMTKLMDMGYIRTRRDQNMRVVGETTSNMDLEKKFGKMALYMKEISTKESSMDKDITNGQMGASILEIGSMGL